MGKNAGLVLVLVVVLLSLAAVEVLAASEYIPKPSIPEFNVKYIDNSYYVPPMTSTDPYKGPTVTQGYEVVNRTIELTIKNQPAVKKYGIIYSIRYKGHLEQTGRGFLGTRILHQLSRIRSLP